jgi:uncharacterized protein YxjI
MSGTGAQTSLTGQNLLMMQQVTGFMSNDFAIQDGQGRPVAHIHTQGSAASRLFRGNRTFVVVDVDGIPLFTVEDPMGLGRDRYRITEPQGGPIAELTQRFAMFRTSMRISVVDGTELRLDGSLSGFAFQLMAGDVPVATVDRKWAGLGQALRGRSRYAVHVDPAMPELVRYAVIGGVIALDLIRDKANRND